MFYRWLHVRLPPARLLYIGLWLVLAGVFFVLFCLRGTILNLSRSVVRGGQTTAEGQPAREYVVPDDQDLTGEGFERPMLLRDPAVRSSTERRPSGDVPELRFVSIDLKLGPIFAIEYALRTFGVKVSKKSLSPYCRLTDTCSDLKFINASNVLNLGEDEAELFWRHYSSDPEFREADGFVCINPLSLCQLLARFRKPMILIVDERYDLGKADDNRWIEWSKHFVTAAHDPNNVVIATNSYDKEYAKYFTHVSLPVVPYACDYVTVGYDPRRVSYLLMPVKRDGFARTIVKRFEAEISARDMNGKLDYVVDVYGESYSTDQIVQHAGVVVIPHRVSFLALTELRRLNVPMFFPTVELLARWQIDDRVMDLAVHDFGSRTKASRHSGSRAATRGLPDPNDDSSHWAVGFWLTYSEFFSWPGIKYFNSVEDLALKINATTGEDLYYANQQSRIFNEQEKSNAYYFWKTAIARLRVTRKINTGLNSQHQA